MERINVAVRARPLSPEDAKSSPWRISGNSIFFTNQPTKFEFDRIFREDCRTVDVYESRTKDIVTAAVGGFNGTVFAYGQTNSGKTHTMRGSTFELGVIPLAVHDLFDMIQQEMDREFLLRMSYMEIYNEEINDLLAPEHRKLQIHESIERGIFVAGLREEIVTSPKQVLEFMEFGEAHRHIGETNMNVHSSRSHTIFRMIIESRDKAEDEYSEYSCDAVRVSVLNLVDLAGSERAAKTGAEGVRLKEGSHINKSLMTLGTVIKKLSEGAESQGSHVPYRDSKLTRILQPALGGNANTAIICNITLAQIHADETKSSLQFASRALRVTNCVHVNEILTDAALLKRQKKEIEDLRAKLQGSHSDHLGEEILNLRNTLLQSELERERIALELEEEKKAQAERERRLLEQAKKIENLSSMVLCSNRDENFDHLHRKKEKRRDTWCPGKLPKEMQHELSSVVPGQATAVKPVRTYHEKGRLLPFEELVDDDETSKHEECHNSETSDKFSLPDPHSLLHVTSRKKPPARKKSLHTESDDLKELQKEYEDLLLTFETQKTMSEIHVDYLLRKLAEAGLCSDEKFEVNCATDSNRRAIQLCTNTSSKDLEILMLEMEKSSSLQNFEPVVELAAEQNIFSRNKYEEDENSEFLTKLSVDVQEISFDIQHSKALVESVTSMMDEHLQSSTALLKLFTDLRCFSSQNPMQIKELLRGYEKLCSCMKDKANELEHEKLLLYHQSKELQERIENASLSSKNSARALTEQSEQYEAETTKFLSEIQELQNEISYLSSSAFAKENESMRKELEKTKTRQKEMEFNLRNTIQEKTKLESEKAFAEKEIKRLRGRMATLERDINKRESIAGRRRDSILDRSSNVFDSRKPKGLAVTVDQDDYRKLEVLAFEMETAIASLEEKLAIANNEKHEALLRVESLVLEVQELSDKLDFSKSELHALEKLVSSLGSELEQATVHNQKVDSSINMLVDEKEEMALQLTDALLAMEEERAIWYAREKISIGETENKSRLYRAEISSLTDSVSEAKKELEVCRKECKIISEKLESAEGRVELEKTCRIEKSLENERLTSELRMAANQSKVSEEEEVRNSIEKAKLRMRLKGAQTKLDTLRLRYKEEMNEREFMHKQFEAATAKMKVQLASVGVENLNLKKQLSALKGQ